MIGAFFIELPENLRFLGLLLRIFIAALCGFSIGFERKSRSKEAGIRTHSIVCMAAAVMMIVSKYGFMDQTVNTNGVRGADSARIAAQVVSGIGFLGAGIIFYKRDFLHGLTTAAGIWATAGIGLAIGAGGEMVLVGIFSTVLLVLMQILLHRPIKFFKGKTINVLRVVLILDCPETIDKLSYILEVKKFVKFKTSIGENGLVTADVEAATEVNFSAKELYEFTRSYPFIKSIEKTEEL